MLPARSPPAQASGSAKAREGTTRKGCRVSISRIDTVTYPALLSFGNGLIIFISIVGNRAVFRLRRRWLGPAFRRKLGGGKTMRARSLADAVRVETESEARPASPAAAAGGL